MTNKEVENLKPGDIVTDNGNGYRRTLILRTVLRVFKVGNRYRILIRYVEKDGSIKETTRAPFTLELYKKGEEMELYNKQKQEELDNLEKENFIRDTYTHIGTDGLIYLTVDNQRFPLRYDNEDSDSVKVYRSMLCKALRKMIEEGVTL
jgi:hypothetical protein